MIDESSEIFEQVNEDLKRQQLKEMWDENKNWIIGGIIASIVATGAMSAWRNWEFKRDVAATVELTEIVKNGADPVLIQNFANKTDKNHAIIARLILASDYIEKKDTDSAVKLYDEIASTIGAEKIYKNFARLLSVKYRSQKITPEEALKEIEPLTDKSSGWSFSAMELKATILAKKGDFEKAVEVLNIITSSPEAPEMLRQRAVKLTELYESEKNNGK